MLEFAVSSCRDTVKNTVKSSCSYPLSRNLTGTQPSATSRAYHGDLPLDDPLLKWIGLPSVLFDAFRARYMSMSSTSAHDISKSLQDAANAVMALGRVVSALSEALSSAANLEMRLVALERAIVPLESVGANGGREGWVLQPMERAEMRSHVDTNTAAQLLGRKSQTLRKWACYEDGPLRPVRVNGRLAWAVADIRRLLSGD